MTDRDRIDSTSLDQRDELIHRLRDVAPEAFTDGAINLDRLSELVGLPVDNGPERYGLTWPGKRAAIAMLQAPSAATLAPDESESVNFDGEDQDVEYGNVFDPQEACIAALRMGEE